MNYNYFCFAPHRSGINIQDAFVCPDCQSAWYCNDKCRTVHLLDHSRNCALIQFARLAEKQSSEAMKYFSDCLTGEKALDFKSGRLYDNPCLTLSCFQFQTTPEREALKRMHIDSDVNKGSKELRRKAFEKYGEFPGLCKQLDAPKTPESIKKISKTDISEYQKHFGELPSNIKDGDRYIFREDCFSFLFPDLNPISKGECFRNLSSLEKIMGILGYFKVKEEGFKKGDLVVYLTAIRGSASSVAIGTLQMSHIAKVLDATPDKSPILISRFDHHSPVYSHPLESVPFYYGTQYLVFRKNEESEKKTD